MAYCGLQSRAIYHVVPLTCNFPEFQCWQKTIWRITTTMLRLGCLYFFSLIMEKLGVNGGHQG